LQHYHFLQHYRCKSFHTAERTLEGIEAVNMIRKGQVKRLAGSDARGQAKFVTSLFQVAA
jgi:transposase-like protein